MCLRKRMCAFWFGAPERLGRVGLHRPRFDDPRFGRLPPMEAAKAYKGALQRIARYLGDMEAPTSVFEAMALTGSADILWVDDGVSGDTRMDRAASFAEWADASCGALPTAELKLMLLLRHKKHGQGLSAQEEVLHKLLSDKDSRKTSCEINLVLSNRDRLPLP